MNLLAAIPTGLIAFLVVVAINVVIAIAKASSKRKQQSQQIKARQTQQGRQAQVMVGMPQNNPLSPGGLQPVPTTPAPRTIPMTPSVDELAVRRQAQLEQLRLRRETQRRGTVRAVSSAQSQKPGLGRSAVAVPAAAQQRPTFGGQGTPAGAPAGGLQAQRNRDLREKQRTAGIRAAQERAALEHDNDERARRQATERRRAESRAEDLAAEQAPSAIPRTAGDPHWALAATAFRSALQTTLAKPESLRQLLVLKELLDPPLSMRLPQV